MPIGPDDKSGDDISEQNWGEPLQDHRDLVIAEPDGGVGNSNSEDDDVNMRIDACKHLRGVGHCGKIRANIDAVRSEHKDCSDKHQPWRTFSPERIAEAHSCDHSDASAHELDAGHERPGNERRPKKRSAELRARDRISGYSRRIVIGRAGNETRPKFREETL
jgi:hypothetical protein